MATTLQEILSGTGVYWLDEKIKINANFSKLAKSTDYNTSSSQSSKPVGPGIVLKGSDTYAHITGLRDMVTGDMWIVTDTTGDANAGDGLFYNGTAWVDIGQVEGISFIAASNLSAYRSVIIDDNSKVAYADSSQMGHINRILGITTRSCLSGHVAAVVTGGVVNNSGWSWTIGNPIFLSSSGALTQTPPTTGFLQIMGFPLSTTSIYLQPQEAIVLSTGTTKYLKNNSGIITEVEAIATSAGAGDSGKIPSLDADGILDKSFFLASVKTIGVALSYQKDDKPSAETEVSVMIPEAAEFPTDLVGTLYFANAGPAAEAVVSVCKNGTEFATIAVAIGSTSVATPSGTATSFEAGDRLSLVFPATQDATWAGVSITVKGIRS